MLWDVGFLQLFDLHQCVFVMAANVCSSVLPANLHQGIVHPLSVQLAAHRHYGMLLPAIILLPVQSYSLMRTC